LKHTQIAVKSSLEINRVTSLAILPKAARDFVLHYVETGSKDKAALRAGYNGPSAGSKLLKSKKIKKAINDCILLECERFDASEDSIIRALTLIVNANISDYLKWDNYSRVKLVSKDLLSPEQLFAIDEISESHTGAIRVKLKDKLKALESLAKIKGMFTERKEVVVHDTRFDNLSYDYDMNKLSVDELFQLRTLLEKAKIDTPIKEIK